MKTRVIFLVILAGFALALAPPAAAQTVATPASVPTIDQSLELRVGSAPRISPDGRWVVYQVSEPDWEENAYVTQLWLVEVETGEQYQLTRGKKSSTSAAWSPDGRRIAFVSDRDGKRQIYLIAPDGGEAWALTAHETAVGGFEWSRDGARIAFTAPDPETEAQKEKKKKYGDFYWEDENPTMSHLWVVDVPAEPVAELPKPTRLTEGQEFTVTQFAWSPDGARIAFAAPESPDPGLGLTSTLYVVNVADRTLSKPVQAPGPHSNPMWSPDGSQLAFRTPAGQPFTYWRNMAIAVVPAAGGEPRILTGGFDEHANGIEWNASGIYFGAIQRTAIHLFRLDPASGSVTQVSAPADGIFNQFSFTREGNRAAFMAAGPNRMLEVHVSALAPFAPRALTRFAEPWKDFQLATREIIRWHSVDGTEIEGVLWKPAEFDPAKKHPLLFVIHGGPTATDFPLVFPDRYYPQEIFVGRGALVLHVNYRGSGGYGEAFRSLNVRNLGVGDGWDITSALDHLVEKGWVDPARVGAMGWSQGGYISAFLTTWSDRFRAVSVGAGISNWTTYYVNTDIHPFTRMYLQATPWDDPEIYTKTSPITYIRNAKTPTLIQHGENDRRVPIPNAFELYQGLRDHDVPVRLAVFRGFGHGINKPKEMRAVMQQNLDWFLRWIWDQQPAEDSP
jgi:dipeptidyl aminopeptidase/acylaminoacyl peptidase